MIEDFDHGLPENKYNKHAWILGKPDIGENVWIGAFCLIDALHAPLRIGKGVNVSSGAQILTHSTVKRCVSEKRYGKVDSKKTEIGEFTFIGTNAVILMGSNIGHHSVVAAGAVISENSTFPPFSLIAGVPAKRIGSSKRYLEGVEKESLSIVIPAYNEEKTLKDVVDKALKQARKLKIDFEIVLVDDGSKDKTKEIIKKLSRIKNVRGVYHNKNKGFTGAMKTCFKSAKKHLIFLAPADGQYQFRELKSFVERIKGHDVAVGYRKNKERGLIRQINSFGFHFLCKSLLNINLKEISSVSLWRKEVFKSIKIKSSDRSAMFLPELISKTQDKKFKFTEVPITWGKRKGGEAKGANPLMIFKTFKEMVILSRKL